MYCICPFVKPSKEVMWNVYGLCLIIFDKISEIVYPFMIENGKPKKIMKI